MALYRTVLCLFLLGISSQVALGQVRNGADSVTLKRFGFALPEGTTRVEFPFEIYNNLVVVNVRLQDRLPLKFILDTGVRTALLTDRVLGDMVGLNYTREMSLLGAGATVDVTALVASDATLELPDNTVGYSQDLLVLEEDFLQLEETLGTKVHGILGYEVFRQFVVRINYPRRLITLYDPASYQPGLFAKELPLTIVDAKPYVHTLIEYPDGRRDSVRLLLDTGASHALWLDPPPEGEPSILPADTLEMFLGRGLSGNINGSLGRIPYLGLGPFEFTDVITSFPEPGPYVEPVRASGRSGSIGSEILRRFYVSYDYRNGRIFLEKNYDYRQPFEFNMAGMFVLYETLPSGEKVFLIDELHPEGAAKAAGLQEGDQIIRFKGMAGDNLTLRDINYWLKKREGKKIKMTVLREGEPFKVKLVLERLI